MSAEEFECRLEPLVGNLPMIAEGHAGLVALLDRTIAELTERLELVGLREERDLALGEVMAGTDVSHDGALRERYHAMATREQHAAFRTFRGLVELRHKYGAGDPEASLPAQPEPDQAGPQAPAQSEATVPEVDRAVEEAEGPIDVTGPPLLAEAPNPKSQTAGAAESPEEDEAIRAAYQARLQRVLERIEQGEADPPAERDPAARDRPPLALDTSP
jgi:hypothetical protein